MLHMKSEIIRFSSGELKGIWTEYNESYGRKLFTFNQCKTFATDNGRDLEDETFYSENHRRMVSHMTDSSATRIHNMLIKVLERESWVDLMVFFNRLVEIDNRLYETQQYNSDFCIMAKSRDRWSMVTNAPINRQDGEIPWLFTVPAGNFSVSYLVFVDSTDDNHYGVLETVADSRPELIQLPDDEIDWMTKDECVDRAGNNGILIDIDLEWSASRVDEVRYRAYCYDYTYYGIYDPTEDSKHHRHADYIGYYSQGE